jgi:hypothetical protein
MGMICSVCGAFSAAFVREKGTSLCAACDHDTPHKVCQLDFDVTFWSDASNVPYEVRSSFYADYLYSSHDVNSYVIATSTVSAGTMVRLRGFEGGYDGRTGVILSDMEPSDTNVSVLIDGKRLYARRWEIASQLSI